MTSSRIRLWLAIAALALGAAAAIARTPDNRAALARRPPASSRPSGGC
jgi:hypothetical protein